MREDGADCFSFRWCVACGRLYWLVDSSSWCDWQAMFCDRVSSWTSSVLIFKTEKKKKITGQPYFHCKLSGTGRSTLHRPVSVIERTNLEDI